ncbi:MAG: hypothetical protein COY40_06245 [Alphaproteobacteria bacterium CG_4_10_14_0_8_um_filter_53_9]|nr:MAG: hypothetical protein COY40_06245 [Alphaproteobacteria bacterium CG_4_10_14_0_8_um_filter_53_9]
MSPLLSSSFLRSVLLGATALTATGCAPVIMGGAATAGYIGLQDRPVTQTAEDTKIKVSIKDRLTQTNTAYLTQIGIDVFYGDVLLTGVVPTTDEGERVLNIVRATPSVKKIYNELFVGSSYSLKQKASDTWVSAQLQPRLLAAKDAYPLNYLLSVVNGHVYVIGTVSSAEEHEHVLHILRTTKGVRQVHDYLTIENPDNNQEAGAPASAYGTAGQGRLTVGSRSYTTQAPDPLGDSTLK